MMTSQAILVLLLSCLAHLTFINGLPTVDPGVFVVQGVPTCREGRGYCLLGRDCTIDKDFAPDDLGGNCEEVTKSFTSMMSFVCCKYVNDTVKEEEPYYTTLSTVTNTDYKFQDLDQNPMPIEVEQGTEIPDDVDLDNVFNIVGVITDTTGILGLVTEPYKKGTTTASPNVTKSTTMSVTTNSATTATTTATTTTTPATTTATTTTTPATTTATTTTTPATTTSTTTATTSEATTPIATTTQKTETPNNEMDQNYRKDDKIENADENTISNYPSADNQLVILNLPEEIRKYLAKTQSEDNAERDKTTVYSLKDNFITTLSSETTHISKDEDTTLEPTVVATMPFDFSTEPSSNTQRPTNLKGNPLVPLKASKNTSSSTTSNVRSGSTTETLPSRTTSIPLETSTAFTMSTKSTLLKKFGNQDGISNEASMNTIDDVVLPSPINLNICGLRRSNLKVSKRMQTASTYDWCWSAALMNRERGEDKFECSGTLVELDLVITTAACLKRVRNKDLSTYRIVLGDSNLRDDLPYGVQYHEIQEIVTHPDYLTSGGAHVNDIGLIRLRELATIDHNVCLACVSQENTYIPDHSCMVSGYTIGDPYKDIRNLRRTSTMEGILRESPVTLQPSADCQSAVRKMAPNPLLVANPHAFLCDVAGKSTENCVSVVDGGSPLVCEIGGRWFLTGISSWSGDCQLDPNIYTKVSAFSDWFLNTRLRMYGFITLKI